MRFSAYRLTASEAVHTLAGVCSEDRPAIGECFRIGRAAQQLRNRFDDFPSQVLATLEIRKPNAIEPWRWFP